MAEIIAHSAANPEFPRVIPAARLRGLAEFPFDLSPSPGERGALARLMGARAVRKLRFQGRLTPAQDGAWRLAGDLGATVVQTCVVTLEPVTTRIDAPVRRLFAPHATPSAEIDPETGDDDEAEPLGEAIDLGLVAIEALALALPDYPRAEGAELGALARGAPPGAEPIAEGGPRPFAALAALRARTPDGS